MKKANYEMVFMIKDNINDATVSSQRTFTELDNLEGFSANGGKLIEIMHELLMDLDDARVKGEDIFGISGKEEYLAKK